MLLMSELNKVWCKREIKKTVPFTIASKATKYLEIPLRRLKDLYTEIITH